MKKFLGRIKGRLMGDNIPKRYSQLYSIIKEIKPKSIMEVGVWTGGRAVKMIKTAQKYHDAESIEYRGFDLFEDLEKDVYEKEISKMPPTQKEVQERIETTGAKVNLYKGDTMVTMPEHCSQLGVIDFVYIDGGHSLETVQSDWDNTRKVMGPDTVVVFDDYWPERPEDGGSKMVVDALNADTYNVEIMPITDTFDNPDFGRLVIQYAKVSLK